MSGPSSVGTPRLLTGLTSQSAKLCVSPIGLFCELATPVSVNLKGRGVPTDEVNTGWRGGMVWYGADLKGRGVPTDEVNTHWRGAMVWDGMARNKH